MLELPHKRSWAVPLSARRDFESFAHVFGCSSRVFAVLGRLHLASGGRILLRDFLATLSCAFRGQETGSVVTSLLGQIERAGWERVGGAGPEAAFRSQGFELSVRTAALPLGKGAMHVFLAYGSMEAYQTQYLNRLFPHHAARIVSTDPPRGLSGQPWRPRQTPRVIRIADLARRLRGEPCTVLTGAGVSTASGIRPFTGPGSLDACFRLAEPFPGSAFDWVLHRPSELASLVGSFQASVLTAQPNRADLALVELERRGVVKQVLTSNFDDLHQAAGSACVKEIGNGDDGAAVLQGRRRWRSAFPTTSTVW